MSGLADDIIMYYDYLVNEMKLDVMVNDFEDRKYINIILPPRLLLKNRHSNPYCLMIKQNAEMFEQGCVSGKYRVFEKCAAKRGDFFGMCFAGCCEFIYPLEANGRTIGFCSVGGYRQDEEAALSKIRRISEKYGADGETLRRVYYGSLSAEIPEKARMDILIKPLCRMIELYCTVEFFPDNSQNFEQHIAFRAADYVLAHYAEDISLKDISEKFNYSEYYISRKFHEQFGLTLREYATKLRLDAAMNLLRDTRLGILEISSRTGYTDSNYFSSIFRKKLGMSPSEYRRLYSQTPEK